MESLAVTVLAILGVLEAAGGFAGYKLGGGGGKGLAFGAVGAVGAPFAYLQFMKSKNKREAGQEQEARKRWCALDTTHCSAGVGHDGTYYQTDVIDLGAFQAWKAAAPK
jgi:uncharacterized protein YcfJ